MSINNHNCSNGAIKIRASKFW